MAAADKHSPSQASPHSTSLEGRVAIITGGTGGIGSAVAAHLASLGANVVITYIGDPTPAHKLVSTINSKSSRLQAAAFETDVSDASQVKALFDHAQQTFGPDIHILVTTAAVIDYDYPNLAETSEEKWDWMFDTNAKGTFLCCREAAKRLVKGRGGRIITFSSSTVGSLRPGYCAYAASKAAVETLTRILARELKGTKITANTVSPGPTTTPMFYAGKSEEDVVNIIGESPLERLGTPDDVAPLVGFLASDGGEWVNSQVIRVNGGYI